ncbi:31283_t:CDS:2 [Gigaspora margarita]|uniref:31283_t:CDS:1 n=1 Tax=Gigaspora margarita TaxID=4874 RepID=A0ABM8W1D1_GIGMA|nr:31283_t:CDS:2 [Gigaspora margarita]
MNLASFPNLEEIVVEGHFINGLILTGCSRLRKIHASNNLLREVIFPYQAPGLEDIMLTNNNFREQNLSCFTRFTRLHRLFLGTDNPDRINQGIYNRWCGSLIHLLTLTRLQELDINATDINSGLKYLPTRNLFLFTFGNKGRTNARINNLKAEIENYLEFEEGETMEEWAGNEEFEDNMGKVEDIRSWQCHQQQTQFFARTMLSGEALKKLQAEQKKLDEFIIQKKNLVDVNTTKKDAIGKLNPSDKDYEKSLEKMKEAKEKTKKDFEKMNSSFLEQIELTKKYQKEQVILYLLTIASALLASINDQNSATSLTEKIRGNEEKLEFKIFSQVIIGEKG